MTAATVADVLEGRARWCFVRGHKVSTHDIERFRSKASPCPVTGCWWWNGACDKDGYGKFQTGSNGNQKHWRAHRFALLAEGLDINNELVTRHLCNNGHLGCVNPEHLRLGTQAENRADTERRRVVCKKGHPFSGTNINGARICRACINAAARRSRSRGQRSIFDAMEGQQ